MNGDVLPEEQGEHKTYLLKRKHYLTKIIDEFSSALSVADKVSNYCSTSCLERCSGVAYSFKLKPFAAFALRQVKTYLFPQTNNLPYSSGLIYSGKLL